MKHTAKMAPEWPREHCVNVLERPSWNPEFNPIQRLWTNLKMAVQRCFQSNLMELERFCKDEWKQLPNNRCAKLEALYSRLEAVIAAEGALTKYKVKAVNSFINVMFLFLFVINLQEFYTNFFHFVISFVKKKCESIF
uniref:Tc1-like transposase DDE domain-containing protein n=1 Tax=Oreochromis aureus TaxID=47969 RepID=A0AAZ1XIP8_OREAU